MLPRYANPHFLPQSSQVISRVNLEDPLESETGAAEEPDDTIVTTLEALIKRSLGDFSMDVDYKHLEEGRKKKRRKIDNGAAEGASLADIQESMPFRLLSSTLPPKSVSLQPKPAPIVKVLEPSYEDDEKEAKLRAERASAIAVDLSWLTKESLKPYYCPPRWEPRHTVVTLENGSSLSPPPMMLVEIPRSKQTISNLSTSKLPEKTRPSPHNLPSSGTQCPIFQAVATSQPNDILRKKKRARQRKTSPPGTRPAAAFWRPLIGLGGKSGGYAWGYEGSRPVSSEEAHWRGYRRDKIKKAEFIV